MAFVLSTENFDTYTRMKLEGALDSASAPQFHEEVQKIVQLQPENLVLDVEALDFMASAGLRVLIFAKQKLGTTSHLYLVKPQPQLVDTLTMTGLVHSVSIVDNYPA